MNRYNSTGRYGYWEHSFTTMMSIYIDKGYYFNNTQIGEWRFHKNAKLTHKKYFISF